MRWKRILSVVFMLSMLAGGGQAFASEAEITNSGENLRTGWYPEASSITPQLVSGGTFGRLWSTPVEGQVYAQPLLADGTLLVATEKNKVYGLNPTTGALKWSKPLGESWNPAEIQCGDLSPSIGVTATPVVDPATGIAYLTHKTYVSGKSGAAALVHGRDRRRQRRRAAGLPRAALRLRAERPIADVRARDRAAAPGAAAARRRRLRRLRLRLRRHSLPGLGVRRLDRR